MARLESKLVAIANASDEAVSVAIHDTANLILAQVKRDVHVITGWLRDSYQKETLSQTSIIVGTKVDYAPWEEFGTSRRPAPHYHFTPAFWQAREFFHAQLLKRMKDLG